MRKTMRAICGILAFVMTFLCGFFLYAILNTPVFEEGESYTFYSEKNSSCKAYVTDAPARDKLILGKTAGESVFYEGNRLQELAEKFEAKLLFTEKACGVTNYYCYSPKLRDFVYLSGCAVNLHIAVSEDRTAVGTPLIFGGF